MKRRKEWFLKKKNAASLLAAAALSAAVLCSVIFAETAGRAPSAEGGGVQTAASVPGISAGAAILIEEETGNVLYEYNADKKMYPASTTKILTALTVLELCEEQGISLEDELVVPPEAEGVEGSSIYLKAGERLTLEELFSGLMLQSGNDAAMALAAALGGGGEAGVMNFVQRMNDTSQRLGCCGSHFANPHGLHQEDHYTTARDLAMIAREALQHRDFEKTVGAKKWSSAETERAFINKNKTVFQYEGGDGVKIGYTKASGRTLAASASRNGKRLIAVVLNDGNWFQDAYGLLDYGFEQISEAG